MSFVIARMLGWALLVLFTGLATAWLRGVADPMIPAGEWHGLFSGLFVVTIWSSLTWLLRSFASHHLVELFQAPWSL